MFDVKDSDKGLSQEEQITVTHRQTVSNSSGAIGTSQPWVYGGQEPIRDESYICRVYNQKDERYYSGQWSELVPVVSWTKRYQTGGLQRQFLEKQFCSAWYCDTSVLKIIQWVPGMEEVHTTQQPCSQLQVNSIQRVPL